MASCPECKGEMNYSSPFYTCKICGLTLSRSEFERMWRKVDSENWEKTYGKKEEDKSKKRREMVDWYLSGKKKS